MVVRATPSPWGYHTVYWSFSPRGGGAVLFISESTKHHSWVNSRVKTEVQVESLTLQHSSECTGDWLVCSRALTARWGGEQLLQGGSFDDVKGQTCSSTMLGWWTVLTILEKDKAANVNDLFFLPQRSIVKEAGHSWVLRFKLQCPRTACRHPWARWPLTYCTCSCTTSSYKESTFG